MTLKAIAEGLLSAFIRSADDVQELNAREEATLVAIDRLYERRLQEIRTHDRMKEKAARRVAAREAAEK